MSNELALFQFEEYCLDTNVVVSFLSDSDDEPYGVDAFPDHWVKLNEMITGGQIVAPRQIQTELQNHAKNFPKVKQWLPARTAMFRDVQSDEQLDLAKKIVNAYPAYGSNRNYLGDLEVITLAGAMGLTVITLENSRGHRGGRKPKIPVVCDELGIPWLTVKAFFARHAPGRD